MPHFTRIAAVFITLTMISSGIAQDRITWLNDLAQAQQMAAARQQLVLIHFWSDDCPPCVRLERNVFNRPDVIRALMMQYVPVKIHAQQNAALAQQYRIDRWPMDVIATPDGQVLYHAVSEQDPNKYIALLSQVAAHHRVGRQQIVAGPGQQNPNPLDQRMAARPSNVNPPYQDQFQADPRNQTQYNPSQNINNPYAGGGQSQYGPGGQVNQPGPSGNASMYGPSPEPGRYNPQPAPAPSQYGPRVADSTGGNLNINAPRNNSYAPQPQTDPTRQQPPLAPQIQNDSTPKFGMDGYCPVTLVNARTWKKGDPKFGARHRGRVYLFVGEAEQRMFLENPNRYGPVLSGYDVVKFVERGEFTDGMRKHGVSFNDQIFLFADEATLQRFWSSPDVYVARAISVMQENDRRAAQQR